MKSATIGLLLLLATRTGGAQASHESHRGHNPDTAGMVSAADAVMSGPASPAAQKHLRLSPVRTATRADSVRAREIVRQVRTALAKYGDTAAASAAGYRMFMPGVKQQRVYHFTNYRHALMEAGRFDAAKPTSLLYEPVAGGPPRLVGAMYTAPRRWGADRLDARIPLSIARWHQHVNWCVPKRGETRRWGERAGNAPLFGPESPIATRDECEQAGGRFIPALFGWMVHVNAFAGDDLAAVFGHDH